MKAFHFAGRNSSPITALGPGHTFGILRLPPGKYLVFANLSVGFLDSDRHKYMVTLQLGQQEDYYMSRWNNSDKPQASVTESIALSIAGEILETTDVRLFLDPRSKPLESYQNLYFDKPNITALQVDELSISDDLAIVGQANENVLEKARREIISPVFKQP